VFAAMFSLSTFVIGPRISGAADPAPSIDATEHDAHGHGTATDPATEGN
jgi:hypothetical protein